MGVKLTSSLKYFLIQSQILRAKIVLIHVSQLGELILWSWEWKSNQTNRTKLKLKVAYLEPVHSKQWQRQKFSLQYQYNIKLTREENSENIK